MLVQEYLAFHRQHMKPERLLGIPFWVRFSVMTAGVLTAVSYAQFQWKYPTIVAGAGTLVILIGCYVISGRRFRALMNRDTPIRDRPLAMAALRSRELIRYFIDHNGYRLVVLEPLARSLEFALTQAKGRRPNLRWVWILLNSLMVAGLAYLGKIAADSGDASGFGFLLLSFVSLVASLAGLYLSAFWFIDLLRAEELRLADALQSVLDTMVVVAANPSIGSQATTANDVATASAEILPPAETLPTTQPTVPPGSLS